jgi:hypothetical protein
MLDFDLLHLIVAEIAVITSPPSFLAYKTSTCISVIRITVSYSNRTFASGKGSEKEDAQEHRWTE